MLGSLARLRVILAYSPQRDKLVLYAAGSGGSSEFERMLDAIGEEVGYGLLRQDGRVVFVTWVGEGVGSVLSLWTKRHKIRR